MSFGTLDTSLLLSNKTGGKACRKRACSTTCNVQYTECHTHNTIDMRAGSHTSCSCKCANELTRTDVCWFLPATATCWFLHFVQAYPTLGLGFHFSWLTALPCAVHIGDYLLSDLPMSCQCLGYCYVASLCSWTTIRSYYTDVICTPGCSRRWCYVACCGQVYNISIC